MYNSKINIEYLLLKEFTKQPPLAAFPSSFGSAAFGGGKKNIKNNWGAFSGDILVYRLFNVFF